MIVKYLRRCGLLIWVVCFALVSMASGAAAPTPGDRAVATQPQSRSQKSAAIAHIAKQVRQIENQAKQYRKIELGDDWDASEEDSHEKATAYMMGGELRKVVVRDEDSIYWSEVEEWYFSGGKPIFVHISRSEAVYVPANNTWSGPLKWHERCYFRDGAVISACNNAPKKRGLLLSTADELRLDAKAILKATAKLKR